jgi:hypothetical protein
LRLRVHASSARRSSSVRSRGTSFGLGTAEVYQLHKNL